MSNIVVSNEVSLAEKFERLDAIKDKIPPVYSPVVHKFGPGVFIREVFLPKGSLVTGHNQNFEHLNTMIKGKVALIQDDDTVKVIQAPCTFVGKPGRKRGYIIEDTIWQNIYPNPDNIKDATELENKFVTKSQAWLDAEQDRLNCLKKEKEQDRISYNNLLLQIGMKESDVQDQVLNEEDRIDVPMENVQLAPSAIHGVGLHATININKGEYIGPARLADYRTQYGRYINHSCNPNSIAVNVIDDDIYIVAIEDIQGQCGGNIGTEITLDYKQVQELNLKIKSRNKV